MEEQIRLAVFERLKEQTIYTVTYSPERFWEKGFSIMVKESR